MEDLNFTHELWRRVSFDGILETEEYEVSNQGRLRWFNPHIEEWEIMKQYIGNGYRYAGFKTNDSVSRNRSLKAVHRIVAEAFCEKKSPKHRFVIHQNFNLLDNCAINLFWVNRKELTDHNRKNPRVQAALDKIKGKVTNSKLTETQVIRLKKKLKRSNNPLYKIAKEFGITHTQLNRIRKGENWGHIEVD